MLKIVPFAMVFMVLVACNGQNNDLDLQASNGSKGGIATVPEELRRGEWVFEFKLYELQEGAPRFHIYFPIEGKNFLGSTHPVANRDGTEEEWMCVGLTESGLADVVLSEDEDGNGTEYIYFHTSHNIYHRRWDNIHDFGSRVSQWEAMGVATGTDSVSEELTDGPD